MALKFDENKMSNLSEPIHLTRDEYRNITRCLGDENFRKLFAEYCSELSDPENRIQYEKEITLLESERGFDVKFIKPLPGYVIKITTNDDNKVFINVCHSDLIGKPESKAKKNKNGMKGLEWNIPYAQTHPRKDFDNRKNTCMVYDVVFHYDALHLAKQNANFRKMLTDTAIDAVESSFNIPLNRSHLKFPKLQYKGVPKMSIIRQKTSHSTNRMRMEQIPDDMCDEKNNKEILSQTKKHEYITPKFKLIHKKSVDYFGMTNEQKHSDIKPDEIVVEVQLPFLNSANDCILNIAQNVLHLISEEPVKYKLQVNLPFEVSEKNGSAKFNTDEKILLISLPVIKEKQININVTDSKSLAFSRQTSEKKIIQDCSTLYEKPKSENRINKFPKFSTNKMDNIFAFTINVRNVDPESICLHKETDSVKCEFSNVGSGFFPNYYVFFVRFPNASICDIEYEEWKNCLILKVILDHSQLDFYYVGLNDDDLTEYSVMEYITDKNNKIGKQLEDDSLCIEVSKSTAKQERKLSNMSIEIKTKSNSDSECLLLNENTEGENKTDKDTSRLENANKDDVTNKLEPFDTGVQIPEDSNVKDQELKKLKRHSRRKHKKRSLSESCCDQLKVILENETAKMEPEQVQSVGEEDVYPEKQHRKGRSVSESCSIEPETENIKDNKAVVNENLKTLIQLNRKSKGILKYASMERSISECSDDQYLASSMDSSTVTNSLDQPNSYLSDSCRKTVRFNEFIKTKLFRSNTSILAQKKKNAKKNESKRRALSRRLSEGESTDNDDKDHVIESTAAVVEVPQYQEHDSGISLHSEAELSVEKEQESDNVDYSDHGSRKNVEIMQSNPIDIVANVGNVGSKSKQNATKKPKTSRCDASKQQQEISSNGVQFKSEMIFDIEV